MLTQTEKLGYLAINEHLTESSSLLSGIARIFCLRVALHFLRVGCKWRCGGSPLCQSSIAVHYYADGQYFLYLLLRSYVTILSPCSGSAEYDYFNISPKSFSHSPSHTHFHPLSHSQTHRQTHTKYSFPLFTQTYPSHPLSSQ